MTDNQMYVQADHGPLFYAAMLTLMAVFFVCLMGLLIYGVNRGGQGTGPHETLPEPRKPEQPSKPEQPRTPRTPTPHAVA